MTVKSMNLVWIVVSDLNKAIAFYTKAIGLKLEECHEQFGWAELSGQEGGFRLGIAQKNDVDPILPGGNAVVTMSVDNLEDSKSSMIERGATCIGEVMEVPGMVKLQMLADSDGNHFQIVESL